MSNISASHKDPHMQDWVLLYGLDDGGLTYQGQGLKLQVVSREEPSRDQWVHLKVRHKISPVN